jgi:hypothetical protein
MSTRLLLSSSVLTVLAACGSVPKQRFVFDAIDVAENPRPCLVVVNDAEDDELVIEIEFPSAETVVTMAPLTVENGKVVRMPKSRKDARDYSGFVEELRKLRLRDPERQLFVLPRKSANS